MTRYILKNRLLKRKDKNFILLYVLVRLLYVICYRVGIYFNNSKE